MSSVVKVIDLFAGPGGLSEGFSRFGETGLNAVLSELLPHSRNTRRLRFETALSIEADPLAHATLELRALQRKLEGRAKKLFQLFLNGGLGRDELFRDAGALGENARREAWQATLGEVDESELDLRIRQALQNDRPWVLIGGPPCQAYSIAGRSRNRGIEGYKAEKDERHFLYEQYLRIVAKHEPPVFVMENVKGLLSSEVNGSRIFDQILADLREPARAVTLGSKKTRYRIRCLTVRHDTPEEQRSLLPDNDSEDPRDFVVRMEQHGIPQARHRVILLGIREDINREPEKIPPTPQIKAQRVLAGLPRLRSKLSRGLDSDGTWRDTLLDAREGEWLRQIDAETRSIVKEALSRVETARRWSTGGEAIVGYAPPEYAAAWYCPSGWNLVLNHSSRGHISQDLHRYLFVSSYGRAHDESPTLVDFPRHLLPKHRNAIRAINGGFFGDRFRVQLAGRPATTITSHISKDGHYYIHHDPTQCRSLSVREAARLQTFPDDYFFCGPRTEQYHQVGNAVPPLFALQIAAVVAELLG